MASSLRELRQRRKSVTTTKKITRAMELIAASRIVKAQQAARAAMPYTNELDHAMAALAFSNDKHRHPPITDTVDPRRGYQSSYSRSPRPTIRRPSLEKSRNRPIMPADIPPGPAPDDRAGLFHSRFF